MQVCIVGKVLKVKDQGHDQMLYWWMLAFWQCVIQAHLCNFNIWTWTVQSCEYFLLITVWYLIWQPDRYGKVTSNSQRVSSVVVVLLLLYWERERVLICCCCWQEDWRTSGAESAEPWHVDIDRQQHPGARRPRCLVFCHNVDNSEVR